jgi:ribA/ribD-fused uncharacterized protein
MITEFEGEFRFLSNFYPSPVMLDGIEYPTVEHAYQAAKTIDTAERDRIRNAKHAGTAKKLGRKVTLRPDWEAVKLQVMEDLIRRKFSIPDLKDMLLATEQEELVEGNYWGDTFWGVCEGVGQNHLGKILMKVRRSYHG